ncbi:hypothetical protein LCGC14_2808120 [marine sediment metagenome]|uniref:PIN domain-containing protein n=1 Tax=marine sediment metagenome TaxID=412755 RepID=A0A0F9AU72_9ZZZZ
MIPMDEEIVLHALNSGFKDFEDALQNYAAVNTNEIDVILTRNVRDFRKSTIAVMTPESFLDQINKVRFPEIFSYVPSHIPHSFCSQAMLQVPGTLQVRPG